jgi:hypothetical protein
LSAPILIFNGQVSAHDREHQSGGIDMMEGLYGEKKGNWKKMDFFSSI